VEEAHQQEETQEILTSEEPEREDTVMEEEPTERRAA
jgi:hypothetical protein